MQNPWISVSVMDVERRIKKHGLPVTTNVGSIREIESFSSDGWENRRKKRRYAEEVVLELKRRGYDAVLEAREWESEVDVGNGNDATTAAIIHGSYDVTVRGKS